MMGLAVSLNNIFVWCLVLFVWVPLALLTWLMIGTILSFVCGPLGYVIALIMMLYYWRH